ncbi:DgyrCDS1466 [Dimorphilus gyrociliatus]|uniref:Gamma-aminobutyric acid receptor subunit beta n=2 Tax=Dimorphilus gyrociliatus TaxID=2664684 RepID=A0A7I8V7C3_9ANNE|nr:DgyrCDS1466 [Dimorphilus gyrociliatus]
MFAAFLLCTLCHIGTSIQFRSVLQSDDDYQDGHLSDNYYDRRNSFYEGDSANVSRILDSLLRGYDKRIRPNYRGSPVEVGVTMHVLSVSSISEVDMDYTVDFYFRQHWTDPRLAFDYDEELCISTEMLDRMWWPDTFFANAKLAKFHYATTKNHFLRIRPNGDVLHSLRLTVTAMCNMDLTFFPMDSQICSLEIESFGYLMKDIHYKWLEEGKSVKFEKGVQMPQFVIHSHRQKEKVIGTSTGNYSRLACEFHFVRSMGYYIIQIYVPSILIVILSWVSFWLSRDAVPARVALGITTVLTMTTLISSTNASLPKISYLKSIDVYLVTCFVMVFSSLVEFASVSYLTHRNSKIVRTQSNGVAETEVRQISNDKYQIRALCKSTALDAAKPLSEVTRNAIRSGVDRKIPCAACLAAPGVIENIARVCFPVSFLLFNCIYWVVYLHISKKKPEDMTDFVPI